MNPEPVPLRLRFRRLRRRLTFLALRTMVRALGFERLRSAGALIGELQFRFAAASRRRLQREVATLLGRRQDDADVRRLLLHAYRCNTAAVLEILAMFDRRQDQALLLSSAEVEGIDRLKDALAGGRGAILLAGHMGNGALFVVQLIAAGFPVTVVHKEARMMDAGFFSKGMPLYGIEGILANEGIKAYSRMLGALRAGRVVYVMADQGTKRAEDGVMLRFLGKQMPMPGGPAQLARHSRAPVLPVSTVASEPRWRFRIEPPVPLEKGATLEADVEQLVRVTELQVLAHPELWSWPHRRWRLYPLDHRPPPGASPPAA